MHNLNGAKVVFLDRDGTINVDHGFVCNLDNFELCEGAGRGLQILAGHFDLFVVTNQSGIGRAMYTLQDMHSVHTHMRLALKKYGAKSFGTDLSLVFPLGLPGRSMEGISFL